jgi:hypothetical protein
MDFKTYTASIQALHELRMQQVQHDVTIMQLKFYRKLILILGLIALAACSYAQTKIAPTYKALEVTYIALNYADLHLTYNGLAHGAYEANPAARWLHQKNLLIPGKILVTGGTLWMFRRMYIDNPRVAYIYLIAANLLYSAVVVNNYVVTVRLKI